MVHSLLLFIKRFSHAFLFSISAIISNGTHSGAFAQYCIPVTGDYCCGFGITKVTFNTINKTSSDASVGYENFSSVQTSVFVGQNYSLYVKCDVPAEHNVKVWIDWNDDKIFDDLNEIVHSANQVYSTTGTVNIPSNALLNTPLRLRVAADYYLDDVPTPCDSLVRGQAEDYTIVVLQNTSPTVADFTAENTITCSGTVEFIDISTNLPTQWLWDFGDSSNSTLKNPIHIYAYSGTFSVTLIASNNNGSDTLVKNSFITVNLADQVTPAACTPQTAAYCCGYGIFSVTFNTINNTTLGGEESYQDYTCTKKTTVTEGMFYTIQITTGQANPEDLAVWLDLNNDGALNDTTEKIFSSMNAKTHSGTVSIPAATAHGIPLRMRIISESVGNTISSCTGPLFGQAEDYSVTIIQFTGSPTADFTANATTTCSGIVNFTDLSYGLPVSWNWEFGDGSTSTLQNPSHTYVNSGVYTVTLVVTNQNGTDTIVKTNYISFSPGPQATIGCNSNTTSYCCGMGIYSVQFNTINNSSQDGAESYKDYSCQVQTTLAKNQSYTISITTGFDYTENVRVWIDFNNNGNFNVTSELVFSSDNVLGYHNGNIFIPSTAATGVPLRMRVSSDYSSNFPVPCQNVTYGQTEDYGVTIVNVSSMPVANFTADSPNTCLGTVNFSDLSANTPTSWLWDFGDGYTSTLKNPQHTYVSNAIYTVSLTATNPLGSNTKTIANYIIKSVAFCAVGEEELLNSREVLIFPNPSHGKFTVSWPTDMREIQIFNLLGQNIFTIFPNDTNDEELDLSTFPDGIYYLKMQASENYYVRKIILEK